MAQKVFFGYGLNIFVQIRIPTIKIKPVSHQLKIGNPYLFASFKNHEKCFLFHLKSSFRSQDI